jgi:hypothetical protein
MTKRNLLLELNRPELKLYVLPYDPAIPLLGIYLKGRNASQHTVEMWNQPWRPPTNEWLKKNGLCVCVCVCVCV